jgi:hypothetical protein
MMRLTLILATLAPAGQDPSPFSFRDVTEEAGLLPHVAGIRGHAAGWGDADGDGWVDLYVGTFHNEGSKPNMLFRNSGGKFRLDAQEVLKISTRANSGLFADLDNDGDLDLYAAGMPGVIEGRAMAPCTLFRNDGRGAFTNVAAGNGACPPEGFAGRSAAVLDFDGDGLLDLLVGDCAFSSYRGKKRSRLFRNLGDLRFEDVTDAAGLPAVVPGLGVAAGDVNGDGRPDFFIAARDGGNRLFLNDGNGKVRDSGQSFDWAVPKGDDSPAGVCFGDVNRDGLPDIVIGQHFKTPWREPVAVRLYLNQGCPGGGVPAFREVTAEAGLKPLPMKAPHVEIQDFDNDGWPDVYVSVVKFADGKPHPVIFRNLGVRDGLPRFREDALAVNDFPTAEDRGIGNTGAFFKKMLLERKILYAAPGPSGDFDNDGRLDLFLASWWLESPSLLLRNETKGGRWLAVRVEGPAGVNRMGVGARVFVYPAGKAGQASSLIGCREISAGYGYTSGQPAVAHFGLGREETCDVEVVLPHGKGKISRPGVKADQVLTVRP